MTNLISYWDKNLGRLMLREATADEDAEIVTRKETSQVPAVPAQVSMLASRTVLYKEGLLQLVESAISSMAGEAGDLARIKWSTAQTVRRDDPLVIALLQILEKTPEQGDALFIAAAALKP